MAHITGGGITDNLPRILPGGTAAIVERRSWNVPPIFQWLQRTGDVPDDDMLRTFNMGIGLIVVCSATDEPSVLSEAVGCRRDRRTPYRQGDPGAGDVTYRVMPAPRPRLGVLISGRGSNLQALIDAVASGRLAATIAIVISNRPLAGGLARARDAGIETLVLDHKAYPSREAFDRALASALQSRGVSLVCLAGFMRLVGAPLLEAFPQAILNIHPSLLPAFPGVDAQKQALDHGVKISGATVHLVTGELDGGPIVMQAAVPVLDDDTPRRSPRASSSRNTGSTRSPCKRSSSAAGDSRGAGSSSGDTFRLQPEAKVLRQSGTNGGTIRIPLGQPRERTSPAESRMRRSCALMVGQTLGHYKILELLGKGGMGEVYLAEDTRLARRVALKVLSRELARDPDRRARFEREARAGAALNHPDIVTIHSVEEADGVAVPHDGARRGRDARRHRSRRAASRSSGSCRSPSRSPTRSARRTSTASCTATSSPPT